MAERTTDQWYLSRDGEVYYLGPYGSHDDALVAGLGMYRDLISHPAQPNELYDDVWPCAVAVYDPTFHVGRRVNHVPTIDVGMVIEGLQADAYEECGECAEGWLDGIPTKEADRLQRALQTALDRWLWHVGAEPTFFTVTDIAVIDPRDYDVEG